MALTATALSTEPRAISLGPIKMQILTFSAASADVSGTATADRLSRVDHCIVVGLTQTAAPTYSGNVITLAFADPADDVFGTLICFGR